MKKEQKVYDFLYADHEKVASLLSQLEENGVPLETSINDARTREAGFGISAKLGGVGADLKAAKVNNYEVRQVFDPLWVNSRQLIDIFSDRNMDDQPELGQFRIFSGDLMAFDQSVLTKLMAAPSMRDFIAAGVSDDDESKKKKSNAEKKKEADIIQTYVSSLGLSIQFILLTKNGGFWFNVDKDNLYLHPLDIPLKHPAIVSGVWKVLGIIDALPNDHFELSHLENKGFNEHVPVMVHHMAQLIGVTGVQFGRRLESYGLKPLIIFKELQLPSVLKVN